MKSINLQKTIKSIFLPALFLSIFLSCSGILFQLSQNTLIGSDLGFDQIPILKIFTPFLQIILALFILVFSFYKPFEKVFKGTLIILTAVIALLTVFMFFQERLKLTAVSEVFGIYKPLVTNWPLSLMYMVLSLVNFNLYSLFIWGFINRLTSLLEGIKYYIPLAFVLGIGGAASKPVLMTIGAYKWSLLTLNISALALMICAFFIFNYSWKKLPDTLIYPKNETSVAHTRFPFLSAAYLLAGCLMIKQLLDILFKSKLKNELADPASYLKSMGDYSIFIGSLILVISIVWAVLGTRLILKKGWGKTALYASISIFVGGVIFLSLSFSWLNQGMFAGFLTSTSSALFFPLIQILYLYLPYQQRFKTKIVTEMIALPIMKGIPSLAMQGLLVICGSIAAATLYVKILIVGLMILLIIASKRMGYRFSNTKISS